MANRIHPISSLLLVLLLVPFASAQEKKVIGTWKLISEVAEIQATGEKTMPLGNAPTGYAIFTPEGRSIFVLTADGRKAAKSADERAALLDSLIAYSGTYTLDKDKWTTRVEVAWRPEWVGTEQTRFYKVDGDRLKVTTPWRVMPNFPEKGMTRTVLTFERSK